MRMKQHQSGANVVAPVSRQVMFEHWELKREEQARFLLPKYEVRIRGLTGLDEGDAASPFQCGVRRHEREEDAAPHAPAPPKSDKAVKKRKSTASEAKRDANGERDSNRDKDKENKAGGGGTKKRKSTAGKGREEPNWPLHRPSRFVKFTFYCSVPSKGDLMMLTPSAKKSKTMEEGTSATRTAPRRAAAAVAPGAYSSVVLIT